MAAAPERVELHLDRDAEVLATARAHRAPALIFALDNTVLTLRAGTLNQRVDRSTFVSLPASLTHELEPSIAGAATVATLVLHASARAAAARDYAPDVESRRLEEVLSAMRVLPRTRWVDELVNRYVFERSGCSRRNSRAARFLEAELIKEVFFLGREQLDHLSRSSVVFEGDALVARARGWLEAHLFEPFHIDALVRHCHASESTVLRAFRRSVGVPPLAYLRQRRLEEAKQLIESGRYSVTEVATRTGYTNASAFAAAFRGQFGVTPRAARPSVALENWLPPHVAPPIRRQRRIL